MRRRALFSLLLLISACTTNGDAPPAGAPPSPPAPSAGDAAAPPSTAAAAATPGSAPSDTFATSAGDLQVTPVHHGTVVLQHGGKVVWVDPWTEGRLDGLPKADLILVTDIHPDHYDPAGLEKVRKAGTVIVAPAVVAEKVEDAVVIKNGETKTVAGLEITAVPMYNLKRGPKEGQLFHDKGRGNGYLVVFGGKRVYLSGDTECIDEMRALKNIDLAFVCMNLPYTMPPSEAAECIEAFKPKVLIPYHFRGSNLDELTKALGPDSGVEVRVRKFY
jgi:L-ascorbate metabolism protein UlaG (beta-lactamase superfamily)